MSSKRVISNAKLCVLKWEEHVRSSKMGDINYYQLIKGCWCTLLIVLMCLSPQKELLCEAVLHKLKQFYVIKMSKLMELIIDKAKRRIALKASLPTHDYWSIWWYKIFHLLSLHVASSYKILKPWNSGNNKVLTKVMTAQWKSMSDKHPNTKADYYFYCYKKDE